MGAIADAWLTAVYGAIAWTALTTVIAAGAVVGAFYAAHAYRQHTPTPTNYDEAA